MNHTPTVLAIIQARMDSTRLPGKVLTHILPNRTALDLMLERVQRSKTVNKFIIATTLQASDTPIVELASKLGIECYRGSAENVLERFLGASQSQPDQTMLVRLTADCPLHDPEVIDRAVRLFFAEQVDYVSKMDPPTFPDGIDVEVVSLSALRRSSALTQDVVDQEHVTLYIRQHPELFPHVNFECSKQLEQVRLTLDHPEDLELIREIFKALYAKNAEFSFESAVDFLDENPEIRSLNQKHMRNESLFEQLQAENQS